jgi:hypothetical protein
MVVFLTLSGEPPHATDLDARLGKRHDKIAQRWCAGFGARRNGRDVENDLTICWVHEKSSPKRAFKEAEIYFPVVDVIPLDDQWLSVGIKDRCLRSDATELFSNAPARHHEY